jgi:tripartite-type tricarboxylate transporter receptor subunit TctC
MRTLTIAIAAFALLVCGSSPAAAQAYPSRAITIIVPFPPGGPTDTLARLLAERMRVTLAQPVVVENVSGAGATIGVARAVRALADGYTLCFGNWTSHVGAPATFPVGFDIMADFAPVSLLPMAPTMIVGRSTLPVNDARELIAWLKANPGKATAGTIGAGSPSHVGGAFFQRETGTSFQFVPYRGAALAIQDLIAGQIDLRFAAEASQNLPYLRGGGIKAFAVMAKTRWPGAPEVPTIDEVGLPGLYISLWNGLWVPKGTPAPVIDKLNAAVVDALADPALRARVGELGLDLPSREQQTPAGLLAFHQAEIDKWWPVIKAANIKAE